MVVATQKGRQRLGNSDDSLARSLHKDVDYPAINVSRRSPDHHPDPPLGPDSRYPTTPTSAPVSGHRKRQNTLLDTGWHTCFKNNNYVFVRNGSGSRPERHYGEKVKDTNSDVTFVITTTAPEKDEHGEKLIVSLDESKPKIKRVAPIASAECSTENTPNGTAKVTPDAKQDNSSGKKHRKSFKKEKKSSNWFKKLTPGKSKLKFDATADEITPIYESSEDSPESCENVHVKTKEIKTIRITPRPESETPVKVLDLIGEGPHKGPHTSTPKPLQDIDRFYKSLPRRGPTPHRPFDGRYSVRRRLPYDEISLSRGDESLFQVSPLSATKSISRKNPEMSLDLSPLERRASCHRKIIESPKFKSRLHPTESMIDIPYADSADELSFDERPKPKINRANSSDFLENVSFDDKPRPRVSRMNKIDLDDVFFNEPPRRKITRANTIVARSIHRERCFSEPSSEQMLGSLPEMRSYRELPVDVKPISSSEPSLRVKRAQSCRAQSSRLVEHSLPVQKAASPMEEEENRSLDWHAKQLRSPDDSTVTFSPYASKKTPPRENPVNTWLKELRLLTESECLNALQAKEIIKEDWITNALAVGNAQETAEKVWETGSTATKHIEEMVDSLKKPKLSSAPFSLKVAQFCSSVVELLKMGTVAEQQITQVEGRIKKSCADLLDALHRDEDIEEWKKKMISELQVVQESIKTIVKHLLLKPLQVIVECAEKATNINSMKRAVFALILLGRLHSTFCEIAVKLGAVRSLLSVIVENKWKDMHPCALRALTVLSCIPTAIKSFEEGGGVDCVCDVLSEETAPEGARSEAAGLVAQITAPWTEGNGYVLQSVNLNADRLVQSIASLASKTESSEVFLLSSAALANLSFAEEVLKKMKENHVLEILVEACRNSPHAASLFIKDQVATVLANMAAKEQYRSELSSGGSLVLLLCFLQLRPSVGHGPPQLAACERIQQKAAIALARLCTNPETSNVVADMQGIQRLVKLCKDRKERNDSDSVLVACLAALRKIASVRQKEEFKKLGAQELVEPRLWDAFIAHSSKHESYV